MSCMDTQFLELSSMKSTIIERKSTFYHRALCKSLSKGVLPTSQNPFEKQANTPKTSAN